MAHKQRPVSGASAYWPLFMCAEDSFRQATTGKRRETFARVACLLCLVANHKHISAAVSWRPADRDYEISSPLARRDHAFQAFARSARVEAGSCLLEPLAQIAGLVGGQQRGGRVQ